MRDAKHAARPAKPKSKKARRALSDTKPIGSGATNDALATAEQLIRTPFSLGDVAAWRRLPSPLTRQKHNSESVSSMLDITLFYAGLPHPCSASYFYPYPVYDAHYFATYKCKRSESKNTEVDPSWLARVPIRFVPTMQTSFQMPDPLNEFRTALPLQTGACLSSVSSKSSRDNPNFGTSIMQEQLRSSDLIFRRGTFDARTIDLVGMLNVRFYAENE